MFIDFLLGNGKGSGMFCDFIPRLQHRFICLMLQAGRQSRFFAVLVEKRGKGTVLLGQSSTRSAQIFDIQRCTRLWKPEKLRFRSVFLREKQLCRSDSLAFRFSWRFFQRFHRTSLEREQETPGDFGVRARRFFCRPES